MTKNRKLWVVIMATVQIDEAISERLDKYRQKTGQVKRYIIMKAIEEYLDREEAKLDIKKTGIKEAEPIN